LDFHAFGYHWPAFNAADSAIVTGVVMILTEGVIVGRRKTVNENDDV
jgi:signal peptidase II